MTPKAKKEILQHLEDVQKDIKAAIYAIKSDHPLAALFNTNLAVAEAERARTIFRRERSRAKSTLS